MTTQQRSGDTPGNEYPPLNSGRYLEAKHFEHYLRTLPIDKFAAWMRAMREFGYEMVMREPKK